VVAARIAGDSTGQGMGASAAVDRPQTGALACCRSGARRSVAAAAVAGAAAGAAACPPGSGVLAGRNPAERPPRRCPAVAAACPPAGDAVAGQEAGRLSP